jgi:asparagine synthase (glutamine-hydrolysing)
MCGIAGIWKLSDEPLYRDVLRKFTDSISHRGPDGAGYYIDQNIPLGFGHRRLSIIDLSENGHQPMSFAEERFWLTYNGEIFNFLELRKELGQKGYNFRSDSDSEVILAAYHCWGKECLYKFNGMWAFAIWDSKEQTLFLARDRFGIKPLYYHYTPGVLFAFASETIAFSHLDGLKRVVNSDNLGRVIGDPNALIGRGHTIFENTFQLLPGHWMLLTKGAIPQQKRWWSTVEHRVEISHQYEDQVAHFRELLEDACRIRMRSDVALATALSGGVDSSAVNSMMHHLMLGSQDKSRIPPDWQQAYVAYFKGTNQDEKQFADEVIRYTGSKAHFVETDFVQLVSKIDTSTKRFDDILGSPIAMLSDLYGAMRDGGIKVSLDGHGVDEMLFGYPYMVREAYQWAGNSGNSILTEDIAQTYLGLFDESGVVSAKAELDRLKKAFKSNPFLNLMSSELKERVKGILKKNVKSPSPPGILYPFSGSPLSELTDKSENLSSLNSLEKSVYLGFHRDMLQGLLRNFDRASMQSQIEIRMPFMDWRLVCFVFSLPLESKIGQGFTKRILRDAMKNKMPEVIRTRKLKIGFSSPLVEWFKAEPVKEFVLDKINSAHFLKSDIWNGPQIQAESIRRFKDNSWTWQECSMLWTYINADIITS